MVGINLEKGKTIYTSGQPMTALHLITGGKISVAYPGGTYQLGKGDVIGICEVCNEIHILSYTALDNTSFLTYPLNSMDSLDELLQKHPDVARLFLLSLFRQISILQGRVSISEVHCSNLYHSLIQDIDRYNKLCQRYRIIPRTLENLNETSAYLVDETPDLWLNSYYLSLTNIYASENYKPLVKEPSISIGMIRKGSLDFRKTYLGIEEQFNYLSTIADFYFNKSGNDLFDFYTSLYYKLGADTEDGKEILTAINHMIHQIQEIHVIDEQLLNKRIQSFRSNLTLLNSAAAMEEVPETDSAILAQLAGSLNVILEFAGDDLEIAASFRKHVSAYTALPDRSAMEPECIALRKVLTEEFYILYSVIFEKTLETPLIPMPVRMFLYFGYVDETLAGASNAATLYTIANNMNDYTAAGVYTFYDWLLAIFNGAKEPSRNEFEQDYSDYIHKQKMSGTINDAELKALESSPMGKVNYELKNMFPQVNKVTFGRPSTFCPLFSDDNVLKDLTDSYVTASKIGKVIQQIKKFDYSAFYREGLDTEHINVMGKETIHREFLPDIILAPNAGIRGIMWQEIEGRKRNSSARMIVSVFHMEDLVTTLIRLTGEFRWEMCKRIQGARWNDISEFSLTSEYFDYVQFYRKSHDLTPEAKEKVRSSLQRAKNSFKEMFVRDYIVWILFEGNGSPRLNKVARRILFTYCPFTADICETLTQNPMYTELLQRRKVVTGQRVHHLNKLLQKIKNGRTPIPETLLKEIEFAQGTIES